MELVTINGNFNWIEYFNNLITIVRVFSDTINELNYRQIDSINLIIEYDYLKTINQYFITDN